MQRLAWVLSATCLLSIAACDKGGETTPPTDGAADTTAQVVKNVDAQPGDTTTCPFSGKTFVVKADHPRVEYEGQTYWVCSESAAEQVRADPAKYLADFDG